eukprot:gb/GECG01013507.1/.p1 GENE.gb/GECG01013507.1/~~gb/GECG01013507.1/.p1  ORF type:complete len:335 (+),score=31.82 gb/GECG01013507.1/:1-1005(+)
MFYTLLNGGIKHRLCRTIARLPHRSFSEESARSPSVAAEPLELEYIENNLFRAPQERLWRPSGARGVFGGQIAAQAMVAAHRTTVSEEVSVHSFHSYFLLPGDSSRPILYSVDRTRNGRSFETRSVKAIQNGEAIFMCEVQFHRPEETRLVHQDEMPSAPNPENLESETEMLTKYLEDPRLPEDYRPRIEKAINRPFPIDIRPLYPVDLLDPKPTPPRQFFWIRSKQEIGEDPYMHRCIAAYASDWSLCGTSLRPHGIHKSSPNVKVITSLDHCMWFHEDFRSDEWMLYEMYSPVAKGGRGLNFGRLFRRDGKLAVTVVQEGLMRLHPDNEGKR